MAAMAQAQQEKRPVEAQTIPQLLKLIKSERNRMKYTLNQPQLLDEMKSNVEKLCEALKHSIDKAAMIFDMKLPGIDELCPEVSKNVSILTVSVRIINHGLCECAANQLLNAALGVLSSIYKVFECIEKGSKNKSGLSLSALVGIVWAQLKALKAVPLDNVTLIGRNIMKTLSVIRDARDEIRDSIRDMEQNECIQRIDPWKFDYSKQNMNTLRTADKDIAQQSNDNSKAAAVSAIESKEIENIEENEDSKLNDLDQFDAFDDLFLGMTDQELSPLQSLRAFQILEVINFVDEVVHHMYLFIVKHFRENRFDLDAQKKWLSLLAESVALLPNHVDELSCCLYPPFPKDDAVCRMASSLLHFVWRVSIEIAEQNQQYKNRKMVIKNKKTKSATAMTGHQWKCKFVNLSVIFGDWFELGTMQHLQEFMENDAKYSQQMEQKSAKKKAKKHKKKDRMRKLKKKRRRKGSKGQDVSASASSLKDTETSQTASVTSNALIDEEPDSDNMINID